ncbi:hypothetical protein ACFLTQ_01810, partial [Chloroflexota bacterium]
MPGYTESAYGFSFGFQRHNELRPYPFGNHLLAALSSISGLINQSLDVQELLELSSGKLLELMGADILLVFLLDEDKG